MYPALRVGDQLVVQGVDAREIYADPENGDIIVFRKPINPSEFIVHRAIAKTQSGDTVLLTTKGDYNSVSLHWEKSFPETYVIGKVLGPPIPLLGYLKIFLDNVGGIVVYGLLMLAILFSDYIPTKNGNDDKSSASGKLTVKRLVLYLPACLMFVPYLASLFRLSDSLIYQTEILAFVFWYLVCLIMPLIINDGNAAVVLWSFFFLLVGIIIGSDIVHQMTGIDPASWSGLGGLTNLYYSFMKRWILLVVPGCTLFFFSLFGRESIEKIYERI
jgi:signal peptidase I